ncbi:hypothetical protein GCM10010361_60640 [Streptomyces olivaceiscleroticus]|uniref:Uncharacterized protein n=1 Tax=Streptomyces olivaceiscleroticus TaxID=68245 RepID=A0ABN1B0C2_9ACTN
MVVEDVIEDEGAERGRAQEVLQVRGAGRRFGGGPGSATSYFVVREISNFGDYSTAVPGAPGLRKPGMARSFRCAGSDWEVMERAQGSAGPPQRVQVARTGGVEPRGAVRQMDVLGAEMLPYVQAC